MTGATGFIGRHLCQQLEAVSASVLALSRSGDAVPGAAESQAMDLSRELPSSEQLSQFDTVFHLAGIAHMRAAPEDYQQLNYRATLDLARRAERAGVRCFVFLSSVRAMGPWSGETPRSETDVSCVDSPYGLSKWQAECELRSEFSSSQMAVYILRPALVYGATLPGTLHLLQQAVAWQLPRPPEGGARSMISVQDLAELMCTLAQEPESGLHTWIVTDGQRYTLGDIHDALRRGAGRQAASTWLPAAVWHNTAKLIDLLSVGAGQSLYQRLFGTDLYDNSALLEATGWRPKLALQQVIVARADAA